MKTHFLNNAINETNEKQPCVYIYICSTPHEDLPQEDVSFVSVVGCCRLLLETKKLRRKAKKYKEANKNKAIEKVLCSFILLRVFGFFWFFEVWLCDMSIRTNKNNTTTTNNNNNCII
ncbi:unnamed protein product [Polarella glacialis]|uniref:Uncharacterized protein n=1 Tax=Polarella glacialis TaxID=89957 RepID=A0A813H774_POLGL|nr:unnamed protein product [Polarella glacialis]